MIPNPVTNPLKFKKISRNLKRSQIVFNIPKKNHSKYPNFSILNPNFAENLATKNPKKELKKNCRVFNPKNRRAPFLRDIYPSECGIVWPS